MSFVYSEIGTDLTSTKWGTLQLLSNSRVVCRRQGKSADEVGPSSHQQAACLSVAPTLPPPVARELRLQHVVPVKRLIKVAAQQQSRGVGVGGSAMHFCSVLRH